MPVKYIDLRDQGGTIVNKATGFKYGSDPKLAGPEELARDLGISSDKINWAAIAKEPVGTALPAYKPVVANPVKTDISGTTPKINPPAPVSIPDQTEKPAYTGSSIVDYLKSSGQDSSFYSRQKLAAEKGITNYTGTAAQNLQLLGILRGDKGVKPPVPPTVNNPPPPGPGQDASGKTGPINSGQTGSPAANLEETQKITDEANKIQENIFGNLPQIGEVDTRESTKLLNEIKNKIEKGEEAPKPPSMADVFVSEKAKLGIEPLETDLARIDSEIKSINTELLIQGRQAGEEQVSMREIGRKKGALQMEAEDRIARLNIEKDSISRQLNNKINTLNMVMGFTQQDFTNSSTYYKNEFDKSIQLYDIISGDEKDTRTLEQQEKTDARANWTVVYNAVKDGNLDIEKLSNEQVLQLKNIEIQAGLPMGMTQQLLVENPDKKIQTVTTRDDGRGNSFYDVLMVDRSGAMSIQTISRGRVEVTGAGSSSKLTTSIVEVDGKKLLINDKTGETIKELGKAATTKDQIEEDRKTVMDDVKKITGQDKKVDPEKMAMLRQDVALNSPELLSWFDNAFEPKSMLNPDYYPDLVSENTWKL